MSYVPVREFTHYVTFYGTAVYRGRFKFTGHLYGSLLLTLIPSDRFVYKKTVPIAEFLIVYNSFYCFQM